MRIGWNGVLAACVVAGFALPLAAQIGVGSGTTSRPARQPYTAQFKTTTVLTLANGTTITRESKTTQAMDSQGRRLTVTIGTAPEQRAAGSFYHVIDPVARTNTSWRVPGKTATVTLMPLLRPGEAGSNCFAIALSRGTSAPPGERPDGAGDAAVGGGVGSGIASNSPVQPRRSTSEATQEDLGEQTIEGVVARGTRTTRTIPAGATGNDAPLVTTTEVWNAVSLGLVVREVRDDPREGKTTKELLELSQNEPGPAIFQPPEGYQIATQNPHPGPCPQ